MRKCNKQPWGKRAELNDPEYPFPKQFLDDLNQEEKKEFLKQFGKKR